ncbi:spore coat protein YlbD [Oceanobacillus sp. FSL H7-0719]|uniref:spore coat protein YlbD n=1 Tax=Oceanobacillus sp. FSL H7-0719 TaxID=2954507 RepID=UPI0032534644
MSDTKLNPEIIRFRNFINKYPKLIKEIRKNGKGWQEIFEQWILLGEEDEYWEQFQDDETEKSMEGEKNSLKFDMKSDLVKQILKYTETLDVNKLQEQVQQLSKTLSTVQELVSQYQRTNKSKLNAPNRGFHWFHD